MAYSAQTIISAALEKIGVVGANVIPNANELASGLKELNFMLDFWSGSGLGIFASTEENFALTQGTVSYTWGTGGNFNSVRPDKIISAYIRDSTNFDTPIDIITEDEYYNISDKFIITDRPYQIFYLPTYPLGKLFVYPPADVGSYNLYISSEKPFTEFATLGTTVNFPPQYLEAIKLSLAVRLSINKGQPPNPILVGMAESMFAELIARNSIIFPAKFDFAGRGSFSIYSGTYK